MIKLFSKTRDEDTEVTYWLSRTMPKSENCCHEYDCCGNWYSSYYSVYFRAFGRLLRVPFLVEELKQRNCQLLAKGLYGMN